MFTDRYHIEANSDQLTELYREYVNEIPVGTKPLPKETYANVLVAKNGKALLKDPDGFALMWREKIRFYEHDPAAQAQKGIRDYFEIRNGVLINHQAATAT